MLNRMLRNFNFNIMFLGKFSIDFFLRKMLRYKLFLIQAMGANNFLRIQPINLA